MHILEYSNICRETIHQKMLACFQGNQAIKKLEVESKLLSF